MGSIVLTNDPLIPFFTLLNRILVFLSDTGISIAMGTKYLFGNHFLKINTFKNNLQLFF